jgi:uncharacterized RDD family membrane protein YckC
MMPTKYGSFIKRWFAHIVDVILASIAAGLITIPFILIYFGEGLINILRDPEFWENFDISRHQVTPEEQLIVIAGIAAYTIFYWLYFAVFESSPRQATPGKMMVGLFVTDEQGRRIGFARALGRTLGKVLSQMFCWLGYILALFTARKQALHDLIASTLVLEPAHPAPYAATAPPQANIPTAPAAPGLSGVAVPAPEVSPVEDKRPEPPGTIEPETPDEQQAGDDKPEQEKQ